MFLKQRAAQSLVMSGMMVGAMTCFAQTDAPAVSDRPQEVGPARVIVSSRNARSSESESEIVRWWRNE